MRPRGQRVTDLAIAVERREHEHPARRRHLADRACGGNPVAIGHAQVDDRDIGLRPLSRFHRLGPQSLQRRPRRTPPGLPASH